MNSPNSPSRCSSTAPSSAYSPPSSRCQSVLVSEPDDDSEMVVPITIENTTEDVEPIADDQFDKLTRVLEKSALFSKILTERMEEDKLRVAEERKRREEARKESEKSAKLKGKKRVLDEADDERLAEADADIPVFPQPPLITGAKMMNHQLEGLQWMVALHQNGIAGILGDEMGLGKTLQTISFAAYLLESNYKRPFLIVCPLSVLNNWVQEFRKFAPEIPVCMYHGSPAERADLRRNVMVQPPDDEEGESDDDQVQKAPVKRGGKRKGKPAKSRSASHATKKSQKSATDETQTKLSFASSNPKQVPRRSARSGAKRRKVSPEESDDERPKEDEDSLPTSTLKPVFPVIVTTYEILIRDRPHLEQYRWGYIVVDEGHRLKNIDCRLIREIKKLGYGGGGDGGGRMILTGTPLQNNIAELWSLLNFVLPEIFKDVDTFQDMFNLPTLEKAIGSERAGRLITSLHDILKPFLLRRLKSDVFKDDGTGTSRGRIPPKKEYVLYAPLTETQKVLYEQVVNGSLRSWLISEGGAASGFASLAGDDESKAVDANAPGEEPTSSKPVKKSNAKEEDSQAPGRKRKSRRQTVKARYDVDGDDDEYFEMLENGMLDDRGLIKVELDDTKEAKEMMLLAQRREMKAAIQRVNNLKLQNPVMQLRNVCSHPFLFDWPTDPASRQPVVDHRLVDYSGKMMVLERLLDGLFAGGHKVLLFSQFTKMLDIIEDWAVEMKSLNLCRIDGSTSAADRIQEVERFQTGGDDPDAPILFLLNWNPQMDIQAQDRAHRIGQTKPVLIYRLVSSHTIEEKIMQRATEKRKLEAMVIAKGKFKMPGASSTSSKNTFSLVELAADLMALEGEKISVVPNTQAGKKGVLSDQDLAALLDRSDSVFATSAPSDTSARISAARTDGKAAFSVFNSDASGSNPSEL
ncbi:hypothetical protein ONZ45_g1180 [Pleurotus djamor]|nr:hypothetical protein ONZ45_g1180 [Pleurotus djamor]